MNDIDSGGGASRVNLERLADEISDQTRQPTTFVPRPRANVPARHQHQPQHEPAPTTDQYRPGLEIIAAAITRLTWKDAEAMGQAVQMKMKEGGSLTAAIQAWAEEAAKDHE